VCEYISEQWVDGGIVDIGNGHAFKLSRSGAWYKEEGAAVVETNIHTATDSCLLGDGARADADEKAPAEQKKRIRDRMRSLRSEGTFPS